MLTEGGCVLAAVSGGADSCALLYCLCELRDVMGLTIYACHVNHGLRGEEADRDEQFTQTLCERLGVELFVLRTDVAAEAKQRGIGTEQCGREIRYAFFEEQAAALNARIATAHTASDNVETVLFHLTRGSGMAGLCGIPPCRGRIIRPLIEVTRREVETYCLAHDLCFVTDSTNLSRAYSRNRIRLDVVPVLRELNPSLESAVSGLSERMREAEAYLMTSAEAALSQAAVAGGYDVRIMQTWPQAVFAAAVRKLCADFSVIPEAKHLALFRKIVYNGGAVEIGGGVTAAAKQGIFRIFRKECSPPIDAVSWVGRSSLVICDKKIDLFKMSIDEFNNGVKNHKFLFHNALDYDTIPLTSCFRTRRSGDQFTLFRRNVTKTVKKLFVERKLPQEQRDHVVLLAENHHVLWIEGIGVGRDHAVTAQTAKVLVIQPQNI